MPRKKNDDETSKPTDVEFDLPPATAQAVPMPDTQSAGRPCKVKLPVKWHAGGPAGPVESGEGLYYADRNLAVIPIGDYELLVSPHVAIVALKKV